jgi:glycosyltransferase involved in cell wall biosynthesis
VQRKLVGVLCTYRRPEAAIHFLDVLEAQDRPPDLVVVVDNGHDDDERLRVQTEQDRWSFTTRYRSPGANLGPAGAFALAHSELAGELGPEDLVLHLDDDDPPPQAGLLGQLLAALERAAQADPRVAGIGLSGGRLGPRTGLIAPVTGTPALEPVDHLHGGYLPVYRFRAIDSVGGADRTFFYGFEELELGRRLTLNGWRLLVHNELMGEVRDRYPKRAPRSRRLTSIADPEADWSRFHKERNLIRILRRERRWGAIASTVLVRHLARPLIAAVRQPRPAAHRIRLGLRATVAGLRGAGGIDPRYPPPA